jgi:hypothetical protein
MSDNGQRKVEDLEAEVLDVAGKATIAKLDRELGNSRIKLDPDLLTPRDMRRARVVLDGRNPFELLDDPLDRIVLIIWCLVSRSDPSFTWDQAEDTPFSQLDTGSDEPDPQTAPPGSPGRGAASKPASGSRPRQRAGGPKRS